MAWRYTVSRLQVGLSVALAVLVILPASVTPVRAQVGLAVVLNMPRGAKVGQVGLAGSLGVSNANVPPQQEDSNVVGDIALVPSCEAPSPSRDCVSGFEDAGVVAVDSPAIGRAGTACAGTLFTVVVSDPATGEVVFDPPGGLILLGPGQRCVIDFTFTLLALPPRDASSAALGGTLWTTAHAGAFVLDETGEASASAGTWGTWQVEN